MGDNRHAYNEAESVAKHINDYRASFAKLNKLKNKLGLELIGDHEAWQTLQQKVIFTFLTCDKMKV